MSMGKAYIVAKGDNPNLGSVAHLPFPEVNTVSNCIDVLTLDLSDHKNRDVNIIIISSGM